MCKWKYFGILHSLTVIFEVVQLFSHEIQIKQFNFGDKNKITILPIGDIHIGAKTSMWQNALNIIDKLIKEYPNLKLIGVGDYGDNATKYSRASTYDNVMTPLEQLRVFQDNFLKKYKDRWLMVVAGNHEFNRLERESGINPVEEACFNLDIPYSKATGIIDVSVGRFKKMNNKIYGYNYLIQVTHGSSAARTKGGQHNAAVRTAQKIKNADIYISGHTHYPVTGHGGTLLFDRKNKKLKYNNQVVLTSASWLGYEGYADRKNYEPTGYAVQLLTLHGRVKKQVDVKSYGINEF